ncbi:MAG: hypothetical protein ABMB14_11720 [Myxococcota bacterium]
MTQSLPSARPWLLAAALAVSAPFGLACAGLPIPGLDPGTATPDPADPADPAPDPTEPAAADPAPAVVSPDSLFTTIELPTPPFESQAIKCPAPTAPIRHPSGGRMNVYCATGSGVRTGPHTEWQGKRLVVSATNVNGKLDGPWVRWDAGEGDARRPVEYQVYSAGVATGDHAEWDLTGQLLVRGRTVDGKRDGRFVERTVRDGAIVPGGACYEAGAELWRTTDDAELVRKPCGSDGVAQGE